MSYDAYRKMLSLPEAKDGLPEGWKTVDFRRNEKDNAWYGTIVVDPEGAPHNMSFYIWSITEENMAKTLAEVIGPNYRRTGMTGGNGHYYCEFEPA